MRPLSLIPEPFRILLGGSLLILLLPLTLIAQLVLFAQIKRNAPENISRTAVSVFVVRLYMHFIGFRSDHCAVKLAQNLEFLNVPCLRFLCSQQQVLDWMFGGGFLPNKHATGTNRLMTLRVGMIDECVREAVKGQDVNQFVIIGAGYDVNSYQPMVVKAAKQDGLRCFEIDKQETHLVKVQAVKAAKLHSDHVTFISCELGKENWVEKLLLNGFSPLEPTLFIWEGVTYYLHNKDVKSTLAKIKGNMALHGSSRLVFDFPFRDRANPALLKRLEQLGEPWLFDLKSKPERDSCVHAISDLIHSSAKLQLIKADFVENQEQAEGMGPFFAGCVVCAKNKPNEV